MRNPPWLRDELILCLDAYFELKPQAPDPKLSVVKDLSTALRSLAARLNIKRAKNYRNAASVVMKMMNFRSIDPEYLGAGLEAAGKGDRLVWNEFAENKAKLSDTAKAIRRFVFDKTFTSSGNEGSPYEEDASEGRILTVLHRRRERNRKIITRKKEQFLARHGRLFCEACRFDYPSKYGERGANFIECHHIKPLAELKTSTKSRLEDLVVVCANCHRMIHVRKPWLTMDELKTILRPD